MVCSCFGNDGFQTDNHLWQILTLGCGHYDFANSFELPKWYDGYRLFYKSTLDQMVVWR